MNGTLARPAVAAAFLGMLACTDRGPTAVIDTPAIPADPVLGQHAFAESCSECHASADGYDVALFGFSDTTIIRRALGHVDSAAARNIAAYIASLGVPAIGRSARVFQPGDEVLASDEAFAVALFGADAWPPTLTSAQLLAIDPRRVKVALEFPLWSDERSNRDWMPDHPLPDAVLDDQNGAARSALATYRANHSTAALRAVVLAVRAAEVRVGNPGAPCILYDYARADFSACFDSRRWLSSLIVQHFLRGPIPDRIDLLFTDVWWETGSPPRRSALQPGTTLPNALVNWVNWQYMGWMFAPDLRPSEYTGGALLDVGLVRHATFAVARSLVARPPNSAYTYADVVNVTRYAPPAWRFDVAKFALNNLLARLASNDQPPANQRALARTRIGELLEAAFCVVNAEQRAALQVLADRVLAALPM